MLRSATRDSPGATTVSSTPALIRRYQHGTSLQRLFLAAVSGSFITCSPSSR